LIILHSSPKIKGYVTLTKILPWAMTTMIKKATTVAVAAWQQRRRMCSGDGSGSLAVAAARQRRQWQHGNDGSSVAAAAKARQQWRKRGGVAACWRNKELMPLLV
jgi:hypothetical protein